jgi:hypothetical protein
MDSEIFARFRVSQQKRYDEAEALLDTLATSAAITFTLEEVREIVLRTIRATRQGEELGRYAFPEVDPVILADFCLLNNMRRLGKVPDARTAS